MKTILPSSQEREFWKHYSRFYPYLERATPYRRLIQDTLAFAIHPCPKVVCDLGCGSGVLLANYLRNHSTVQQALAFDFIEEFLNVTRERLQKEFPELVSEGCIQLQLHDLRFPLPLRDRSVDVLLSGLVFPYVPEHNGHRGIGALFGLLSEAYRVLKEQGVLVWSTPVPDVNFWRVFWASLGDMLNPRHLENLVYGPVILRHALEIQRKGRRGFYTFPSEQALRVLHEAAGFSRTIIGRSFARQAFLVRAEKKQT